MKGLCSTKAELCHRPAGVWAYGKVRVSILVSYRNNAAKNSPFERSVLKKKRE